MIRSRKVMVLRSTLMKLITKCIFFSIMRDKNEQENVKKNENLSASANLNYLTLLVI